MVELTDMLDSPIYSHFRLMGKTRNKYNKEGERKSARNLRKKTRLNGWQNGDWK